jgi:hypothetical protein
MYNKKISQVNPNQFMFQLALLHVTAALDQKPRTARLARRVMK